MRGETGTRAMRVRSVATAVVVTAVVVGAATWLAYGLVRDRSQQDAKERSRTQAGVLVALSTEPSDQLDLERLVRVVSSSSDDEALVVLDGEVVASRPDIDLTAIPARLRGGGANGRSGVIVEGDTTLDGTDYRAYGGPGGPGREAFLLVPDSTTDATATTLQPYFLAAWAVTLVAAAAGATLVGRARLRRISRARERERTLTADIAHEIRTPLGTVVAAASLLEGDRDRLPDALRRPAAVIATESRRLRRLVEDLLELARLESGDNSLHSEVIAVGDLVHDIVEVRGWGDRVETSAQDAAVEADRLCLNRIVLNLLENALHHGGAPVRVAVRSEGGSALVEVSDAGPGIPADRLPEIFERRTSSDGDGAGLGLAIARESAALLEGSLTVRSEPAVGTTFTLRLPLVSPIARTPNEQTGRP